MAHNKYLTVEDIIEAINEGLLARRTVSQLIQYHKNKGNIERSEMFKEALVLTGQKTDKNIKY